MEDTTANVDVTNLISKFDRLFDLALNTTPSNDNGYRLVLGVLLLLVLLAILDRYFSNRRAERYRNAIEAKNDKRWDDEQTRLANDRSEATRLAIEERDNASRRAAEDEATRVAARDRAIEEGRKNTESLRKQFGTALSPLESRIRDLELEQREHNETIILLRFKFLSDNKKEDKS